MLDRLMQHGIGLGGKYIELDDILLTSLESDQFGAAINHVRSDDGYVYVSGSSNMVKKYNRFDLSYVGQTQSYGNTINVFAIDNEYVYVVGYQTIKKYNKSDLSYVGTSPNVGYAIRQLAIDNEHIYISTNEIETIRKYNKSNLSYVGESPRFSNQIVLNVVLDDNHIYVTTRSSTTPYMSTIKRYSKLDLTYIDEVLVDSNNLVDSITMDNEYIYVGVRGSYVIKKYNKSDLSYVGTSPGMGSTIMELDIDEEHIYSSGDRIRKYNKSDLSYVGESAIAEYSIQCSTMFNPYIYVGTRRGASSYYVVKGYLFDAYLKGGK